MSVQIYIGCIAHTPKPGELEILYDHVLGVDTNGTIQFLVPSEEFNNTTIDPILIESTTKLTGTQFLFPGFIDTHAHAPQYPNCGIFGSSTLLDWLNTYTFPLEAKFSSTELAREVYTKLVTRQIQCGTTTTSYFGTIHVDSTVELAKICLEKGVRANVGRVCMEQNSPAYLQDASITSDIKFCNAVMHLDPEGRHVKPVITPRFAPSCEFNTLKELGKLARELDVPVQTHISENHKEILWVKELFPDIPTYTEVYERSGLLKHDTVLAHAIHLSAEELKIIANTKSGISHCPNSNASIASGIAPMKMYLNQGLKVSLGSDVSGGATVSILKNARLALLMSRLLSERDNNSPQHLLTVADGLFMATLGGAEVLNMDKNIGSFAVGKKFDAQLIDVCSENSLIDVFECAMPTNSLKRMENLIHKWVYVGDDRNTLKVWVDGKLLHSQ